MFIRMAGDVPGGTARFLCSGHFCSRFDGMANAVGRVSGTQHTLTTALALLWREQSCPQPVSSIGLVKQCPSTEIVSSEKCDHFLLKIVCDFFVARLERLQNYRFGSVFPQFHYLFGFWTEGLAGFHLMGCFVKVSAQSRPRPFADIKWLTRIRINI